MEYDFRRIEKRWKEEWKRTNAYRVDNNSSKPSFYVLDMFPYPSGAGLHVGHPLGYIASDIYARFKRSKGFNVLHPMGYDAFGLPAEQYALDHGVHPADSTGTNIRNFREQLDNIGFSFDWSRELRTSDPNFYKWTQWIFLKLFESWYNRQTEKAEPIEQLISYFESSGNKDRPSPGDAALAFSAAQWQQFNNKQQQDILMGYRLAYCGYGEVNWCEALGTVLANDEVINGVSERGGFPVVRKKLRQWYLRITEYADRLLAGLQLVEFSDALKEMQSNWIGRSYGAELDFPVDLSNGAKEKIRVYTTRPDTIFGVDFLVLAPEHELVAALTTPGQQKAIDDYLLFVKSRTERERMAEKKISGCFTGSYAKNPFSDQPVPVWISEYVLAGYGTGAIMAVPCGDERDFRFANQFNIPVTNIIGDAFNGTEANPTKDAILENSGFLTGMVMRDAIGKAIERIESDGVGKRKVNYKMRDAAFSRQRYWGEPIPVKWIDGVAIPLAEAELPLQLPELKKYQPGPDGEGPLANVAEWVNMHLETNTMPGYAGSSWYFLRYMDPFNNHEFCNRKVSDYWGQVDLYIGGAEHAVGHLLYSRMWTKLLSDLGYVGFEEPYKKLINQGMIQGSSRFVYRVSGSNEFVSFGLKDRYKYDGIRVDVNIVDGLELDTEAFKASRDDFADATFILEDGKYICGAEVEKMSKSKFNTVNPDMLVSKYGADTFRMYEMFLGPVEMSKPWDTKGIEGVHRFLKKLWRLFYDEQKGKQWNDNTPDKAEYKILHRTIRKLEEDNERFSFNTGVSGFMVCVNELTDLKCHKKQILEPLSILLSSYAPHIAEELWHALGNESSVLDASWPIFDQQYLVESSINYPVSVNGKLRTQLTLPAEVGQEEAEAEIRSNGIVQKWLEGKTPEKIIFVKGRMINVVVKK
jgi:leucyl-tRNA synthetase